MLVMLNHVESKGTPKATSASPSEKADSPKAQVPGHRNGISDGWHEERLLGLKSNFVSVVTERGVSFLELSALRRFDSLNCGYLRAKSRAKAPVLVA